MQRRLDHIGYRVNNVEEAVTAYQTLFGSEIVKRAITSSGVAMVFITMGGTQLEFLENSPEPGQHLDHVAYEVDDIEAELADLKARGAQLLTQQPATGSNGSRSIRVNMQGSVVQLFEPAR